MALASSFAGRGQIPRFQVNWFPVKFYAHCSILLHDTFVPDKAYVVTQNCLKAPNDIIHATAAGRFHHKGNKFHNKGAGGGGGGAGEAVYM